MNTISPEQTTALATIAMQFQARPFDVTGLNLKANRRVCRTLANEGYLRHIEGNVYQLTPTAVTATRDRLKERLEGVSTRMGVTPLTDTMIAAYALAISALDQLAIDLDYHEPERQTDQH